MRSVTSFLVVLFAVGILAQGDNVRVFEDTIISVTECIRNMLIEGVPEYNVPTFAPLELESAYEDLSELGISDLDGYVSIADLYFSGLTDFVQTNVQGSIGVIPLRYTVSFTLTFPNLQFDTEYDLSVTYPPQDVNIYGAGRLSFDANNFAIDLTATVRVVGVQLTNFGLWISLESLNSFSITGLYNDEEYSASLTDTILADPSGLVAEYAPIVNSIAYDIAMDAVNNGGAADDEAISIIQDRCL